MSKAVIYIVSDSLGETAELVARAAASQFTDEPTIVRVPHVRDEERLAHAVAQAKKTAGAVIFYTLADPGLRARFAELTSEGDAVACVDVLGPAIGAVQKASGLSPKSRAGAMRRTGRSYFTRLEALEFAVAHDDGRGTETLDEAEIVLVGVSRTSKTPLAMYLAYKGWRVANVPIVLGVEPPPGLYELDPERVVGLVVDEQMLLESRSQRYRALAGGRLSAAKSREVLEEFEYSKQIMRRLGCRVIDVTHHAIEETANEILKGFA